MDQWMFRLDRGVFRSILEHFNLHPMLDAFTCHYSAQLPRYMSWHKDQQAVAQDALFAPWDPVTYLFPPVPLGVSSVDFSSLVGTGDGDDGGASNAAPSFQVNPGNSAQLSSRPLPGPSHGSASFRQEFCLSRADHDLD